MFHTKTFVQVFALLLLVFISACKKEETIPPVIEPLKYITRIQTVDSFIGQLFIYTSKLEYNSNGRMIKRTSRDFPADYNTYQYKGDTLKTINIYFTDTKVDMYSDVAQIIGDTIRIAHISTMTNTDSAVSYFYFNNSMLIGQDTYDRGGGSIFRTTSEYAYNANQNIIKSITTSFKDGVQQWKQESIFDKWDNHPSPNSKLSRMDLVTYGMLGDMMLGKNNVLHAKYSSKEENYVYTYDSDGDVLIVADSLNTFKINYTYNR